MNKNIARLFVTSLAIPSLSVAEQSPSVLDSIKSQGVEIVHEFDAPMGLQGYVGRTGSENITFYVDPDESHLIVGTMVNANGKNISKEVIQNEVVGPNIEKHWPDIKSSQWVQDGSTTAPLVLYTFTDPNCPYCSLFRKQVEPWVQSEDIQLRHIMVGVVRQSSLDKAAMILKSDNPLELLHEQQKNVRSGGISVDPNLAEKGLKDVWSNNSLMQKLGFTGTPITVFKDEDGSIRVIQGILDERGLKAMQKGVF